MESDILGRPSLPEKLAARGQFADQGYELLVVRIASRFEVKHRSCITGDLVVVDEEVLGGRIQIDESCGVSGSARVCEHRRVERSGQLVNGEYVVAAVADPCRRIGDGVENLLQHR